MATALIVSGNRETREALRSCLAQDNHIAAVCDKLSATPRLFVTLAPDFLCLDAFDDATAADFWVWFLADESRSAMPVLFVLAQGTRWIPGAMPAHFRAQRDSSPLR